MRSGVIVAVDGEVGVVSSLFEDDGMQQARQRPDHSERGSELRAWAARIGDDDPAKSTFIAEESATLPCCLRSEAAWHGRRRSTSLAASPIFHPRRARFRPIATHSETRSAPGLRRRTTILARHRENQGGLVAHASHADDVGVLPAGSLHTHFPTPHTAWQSA